jgi:hypothetical protein
VGFVSHSKEGVGCCLYKCLSYLGSFEVGLGLTPIRPSSTPLLLINYLTKKKLLMPKPSIEVFKQIFDGFGFNF